MLTDITGNNNIQNLYVTRYNWLSVTITLNKICMTQSIPSVLRKALHGVMQEGLISVYIIIDG